eukprot:COSAG03_NODE_923_length_5297_cov_3.031358_1_plen_67_part_00
MTGPRPKANPIQADSDEDDEPGALGGAGLPSTYREFVKAMLPHVRARSRTPSGDEDCGHDVAQTYM